MLSMEEIVDILEPNQVMFDNELGESMMQRKKKNLNEVYKMYLDMNEYEKIEYKKENSFIKSVLSILDHNFMMYDEKEKNNQVKLLFNKLYEDLDEQGLDKKFGYIRKKDLKKSILKDILIKNGNMTISLYAHEPNNGIPSEKAMPLSDLLKDWQAQSDLLKKDLSRAIEDLSVEIK